jgi:hypothetical protein
MESGEDRIARMVKQLEMEANAEVFVAPKRRGCKRKVT